MAVSDSEQKELAAWKDNRLIDSRTKLTLQALRVFTFAVSKLRAGSRMVSFDAAEFVELLEGREDTKGIYADLREVAKELLKTPVSLPQHHRGSNKTPTWLETSLAASAELMPDGSFQLEFSEKLAPYLFRVQEHYTPLELVTAMSLTSRHAFRLYELCRSWQAYRDKKTGKHKGIKFTLDDLYALLGVEDGEYSLYGHFKSKVLNTACKQIEEKSDLRFRRSKKDGYFDELKEGKKVAAVRFTLQQMELDGLGKPAIPAKATPDVAPAPRLDFSMVKEAVRKGGKPPRVPAVSESASEPEPEITLAQAAVNLRAARAALEAAQANGAAATTELEQAIQHAESRVAGLVLAERYPSIEPSHEIPS